jgi:hypothetical protein
MFLGLGNVNPAYVFVTACVPIFTASLKNFFLFFKGHLLVRQFVHKAGCIQLFLVPIVKNIQFLLVS